MTPVPSRPETPEEIAERLLLTINYGEFSGFGEKVIAFAAAIRQRDAEHTAEVERLRAELDDARNHVWRERALAAEAERDAALARVKELEATAEDHEQALADAQEEVASGFEGAVTASLRAFVERLPGGREVINHPDGWTADTAFSFISEDLNEAWAGRERAEAELTRLRAQLAGVVENTASVETMILRAVTGDGPVDENSLLWGPIVRLRKRWAEARAEGERAGIERAIQVAETMVPDWRDKDFGLTSEAYPRMRASYPIDGPQIAELLRSLTPAPAPSPWRDMASAPRDGSRILAAINGDVGVFSYLGPRWVSDRDIVSQSDLQGWMPLPAPPVEVGGEKETT